MVLFLCDMTRNVIQILLVKTSELVKTRFYWNEVLSFLICSWARILSSFDVNRYSGHRSMNDWYIHIESRLWSNINICTCIWLSFKPRIIFVLIFQPNVGCLFNRLIDPLVICGIYLVTYGIYLVTYGIYLVCIWYHERLL